MLEALKRGEFLGLSWSGIQSIFRKEIIQLLRDPYLVMFIIALPVIQLMVTGLAVQRDLKHIATVVVNYDQGSASRDLMADFQNSTLFDLDQVPSDAVMMQKIRNGNYRVGIIIPPDYSEKALAGITPPQINIIVDGTQGTIAKTIVDGASQLVFNHNRKLLAEAGLGSGESGGLPAGTELKTKVLYNPKMSSAYYLVPAILAIVMHMLTILFTSFAVVRERESGTLEQLMVSPVKVPDLMLGKVLPYAFIGFLDMLLTLGVMVWFFNISISGSFWFLCLASFIFILTSLGIGLLISILCRTQVQAIQLTVAIFLPSLLLTGFVFPLEPMPWFIKIISFSLPLTYYLDIIRGVVIKGIGGGDLWFQTLILLIMAVITLGASILRFNKQIT
ncbi:ABC transporter permease [Vampirovibrio chlorellavorus]|uniref:ABC transporter permease n=1 Tax=Vampirovibrio chlorellavorus TaxID=758823 RepID=UPI0026F261DF|nr:ABC transporter permease [Vampirovibrio chlorellavorus]